MTMTTAEMSFAMHAAVDKKMREDSFAFMVADGGARGVGEATRFAPHNEHLKADTWVKKCIDLVATRADEPRGLPPFEDEAVIVMSNEYSVDGVDPWHRSVYPLRAEGGPHDLSSEGACHRCELKVDMRKILGDVSVKKSLTTFHISTGQFVVEFKVCDGCFFHLSGTYGSITQVVVQRGSV